MTEEWRDIKGYEWLYEISSLGQIISLYDAKHNKFRNKVCKPQNTSNGYLRIGLHKDGKMKNALIHRLVAVAFIPNPENKREVNHKNGIKTDNRVENLEWVTAKENMTHAYKTGLLDYTNRDFSLLRAGYERNRDRIIKEQSERVKGEKNPMSKRTEEEIIKIRKMYKKGMRFCEISRALNIDRRQISIIVKGKRWGHLPFESVPQNLKEKAVIRIKGKEEKVFLSIKEAAKEFLKTNKSAHSSISACCKGKKNSYKGYKWKYTKIENVR